ncbi:pentatricopeptide repeat (PPR) superfamily protein [Artemisia annua]|uniref:Pentatricopeptide repeat (PPR) superfamily protein n=1 Tax=Artemisia annua TaxID=35608 RepID=A0A2U1M1U2_ARTAN|nr:pentatricopeptide repeat (PPR) superfamily protein [Artemisia annua]
MWRSQYIRYGWYELYFQFSIGYLYAIGVQKRGTYIYAEVLSGSFSSDAYDMTQPHPEGSDILLCIENVISQSKLRINLIFKFMLHEQRLLGNCSKHQLESKTVLVDNSVGHGIVNACVNIGLLEKAHGVLDEMNVQGGFVELGVYVSILKAYGNEHRTTDAA